MQSLALTWDYIWILPGVIAPSFTTSSSFFTYVYVYTSRSTCFHRKHFNPFETSHRSNFVKFVFLLPCSGCCAPYLSVASLNHTYIQIQDMHLDVNTYDTLRVRTRRTRLFHANSVWQFESENVDGEISSVYSLFQTDRGLHIYLCISHTSLTPGMGEYFIQRFP